MKFTNKGYVKIIAKLEEIVLPRDVDHAITITVRDTGVGISSEKRNTLFTAFAKLDEHASINPTGCGLGLSISN